MNIQELRRSLGNFAAITESRLRRNTYVPHPRKSIFIETSGRCNLACRFCAYDKTPPGGFMDNATFKNVLEQVCDLGFEFVWLTPMLGEAFADPKISDKFSLLETEPRINGYSFYSNFILARVPQIAALPKLWKLAGIFISIYGFDQDSFEKTTRKPASQFDKLQENFNILLGLMDNWILRDGINFNVRTVNTGVPILERDAPQSELLRKFVAKGARVFEATEYDSWGGVISQSDVRPLGISLIDGNHLYMYGTCAKVFSEVQIKADGQVHACACRDMDGSLVIGDLAQGKLRDILSFRNEPYRKLIESQMRGKFGSNCRSCSSYRSVFDGRSAQNDPSLNVITYDHACDLLKD